MGVTGTITSSPLLSVIVFLIGIGLVIWSVEKFIEHVAEAAVGLGVSTFLLTVVLAGTDLENAILGGAAVFGDLPDVGLGTVFGEALFILCVAVGLAGVLVPFRIKTPPRYLALTAGSPLLLFVLSIDGVLSRLDGALLVIAFVPFVWLIYRWEQQREHRYLDADDELAEVFSNNGGDEDLDEAADAGDAPWLQLGIVLVTVVGMTIGSELVVTGARGLLIFTGIAGLAFGATVMSLIASFEEVFLTVEPVRDDRPEVATGNIVGSLGFFVTANAGVLALIQPLTVRRAVFTVQWPLFLIALVVVLTLLYRGRIGRRAGATLLGLYVVYWAANYLL